MEAALNIFVRSLPFLFGIGFLAPVIAQGLDAAGWLEPGHRLAVGLLVGGGWGLLASITGRWL